MNYSIPHDHLLTTDKLSTVFTNIAASYKFYWFISIIQLVTSGKNKIPIRDILIKMICNAWYPVTYFKLNFGYSDKLSENINKIKGTILKTV